MPDVVPFAVQRRLSEVQPRIPVRGLVVHSTGSPYLPYQYFEHSSNLESTFGLDTDGTLEQYMGADERADANYLANDWFASIETVNHRSYFDRRDWDGDPWSPEQVAQIVRVCDWYATNFNIPRRLMNAWNGSGFGYHIQFPQWHMVPKACPGARRIQQFKQIVIPALSGSYNGGTPVTDADILKTIAGVDSILKDDFARLDSRVKAYITNAANRVIRGELRDNVDVPD